jgi:hypothetical protein
VASFKDALGREWEIAFDPKKLHLIRTELDLDLTSVNGKDFERIADDTYLLMTLLWYILGKQAEEKEVSEDSFAEGLVGEGIDRAVECLLKAITSFFNPSKSALVQAIAEENAALRELATNQAMAKIRDPKNRQMVKDAIEKQMDEVVRKVLTRLTSATDTPGSSV